MNDNTARVLLEEAHAFLLALQRSHALIPDAETDDVGPEEYERLRSEARRLLDKIDRALYPF